MLDREKVETTLLRRLSGATRDQLAAAANAIMGLQPVRPAVLSHASFDAGMLQIVHPSCLQAFGHIFQALPG